MKTVILCGGLGTRLSEETVVRPKPMIEIGGYPMVWHVMKIYATHGHRDFVLALGYKGEVIKEYFLNYRAFSSDLTVKLASGEVSYAQGDPEDWSVSLIQTGPQTLTGGRLKRLESQLRPHGTFLLTYGDGVSDVNLEQVLRFHRSQGKIATVTAVRPPARFGNLAIDGGLVKEFKEKPQAGEGWINGGFFVFEPAVFDYLKDDQTVLEGDPMERLANDGQLAAYEHRGFWQSMDTLRDKHSLEKLAASPNPPWMTWLKSHTTQNTHV